MKKWMFALCAAIVLISTTSGLSHQAQAADQEVDSNENEAPNRGKVDTGS